MAEQWYIWRGEQRYGPYTWKQLTAYAGSGSVTGTDLVWSASTDGWVRADRVPGLTAARPPTPRRAAPSPKKARGSRGLYVAAAGLAAILLVGCVALWLLVRTPLSGSDGPAASGMTDDELSFAELEALHEGIEVADDADWQDYPDREAEQAAIAETLDAFTDACKRGDVDGSVAYVLEERREAYRELFSSNPDAMASFADVIASGEMSFLSEHGDSQPFDRTAEYAVDLDGFTFYVVLMKVGDQWILYDF